MGSCPLRQLRISGLARATLVLLLRWAYGEAVPTLGFFDGDATLGEGVSLFLVFLLHLYNDIILIYIYIYYI